MRVLFWNLGYGRGHTGSIPGYLIRSHRFAYLKAETQQSFISDVAKIVHRVQPDVFSFAEISTGDAWNAHFDQYRYLLGQFSTKQVCERVLSKYGESFLNHVPFHRGNSNGLISFVPGEISEWYLQDSRKKLVLETRLPGVRVLTLHLPLVARHRAAQLRELAAYVRTCEEDVVVCGDFNLFAGMDELAELQAEAGLTPMPGIAPTYPAVRPRIALDVALFRFQDETLAPRLTVLPEILSDHRPIVLEWGETGHSFHK